MKSAVTGSGTAYHPHVATQLSPRQREILGLVAEGRTSKEIAVALGISESTVNWHLANVFERLGASSRAEAVALAMRPNGTEPAPAPTVIVRPEPAPRLAWPRLVAIAIAIAIAGALLGGATVATFKVGPVVPSVSPSASPANGSAPSPTASPTASPPSGVREDVVGGGAAPEGGDAIQGEPSTDVLPVAPATLLPAVSTPALPSVAPPLPTPALPTLPVTAPPLPSLPVPSPIPTPRLGLP